MRVGFVLVAAAGLTALAPPPPHVVAPTPQQASAVQIVPPDAATVESAIHVSPIDAGLLEKLYQPVGYRPLWTDAAGHANTDAVEALRVLGAAGDDGLDPANYRADELTSAARLTEYLPLGRAEFDVELSRNVLRYFHDIHRGQLDPRALGIDLGQRSAYDVVAVVRDAFVQHRIAEAAQSARPQLRDYASLRAMLVRYRAMLDEESREPLVFHGVVRPGDRYDDLPALSRRLVLLGDLPADAAGASASGSFSEPLVGAVKRFQRRHGLDADGVLGAQAQAALNVPLSHRIQQIELALERLRWLPERNGEPLILVNIPMFRLWAWDDAVDGPPAVTTAVIVGRASAGRRTPALVAEMTEVIFRPYWNVPTSIVRHEILPLLGRQPDYFLEQNMELVDGETDEASVVEDSAGNRLRLARSILRLRQRPGPTNALGLIKLRFPNQANVYLHDTPARNLFNRSRRDFSHGCVRVQNPIDLAEWVLRDREEWDRERILDAMNGQTSPHVRLSEPRQVVFFYNTASVWPDDGSLHFADDIYHEDVRLLEALAPQEDS